MSIEAKRGICGCCGHNHDEFLFRAPQVNAPLSEQKIAEAVFGVLRTHASDPLWKALTYHSGPYEVTNLRGVAVDIARAIEREHGIGAPNLNSATSDVA